MGDVFENREAEQLVHGRIHRLQHDHESPQLDLGDVGEPVQRFTIATSALATPQEFGWHGYELELAVDSTPGVAVGVAFSRADADTGRVQRLYPGERFSSVRPFRRVWIVSVGGAGSAVLHLTRVSLVTRSLALPTALSVGLVYAELAAAAGGVAVAYTITESGRYDVTYNWGVFDSGTMLVAFGVLRSAAWFVKSNLRNYGVPHPRYELRSLELLAGDVVKAEVVLSSATSSSTHVLQISRARGAI